MLGLEVLLNFVQALIFSVLTLMYTLIAIESHDEEEHAAPEFADGSGGQHRTAAVGRGKPGVALSHPAAVIGGSPPQSVKSPGAPAPGTKEEHRTWNISAQVSRPSGSSARASASAS